MSYLFFVAGIPLPITPGSLNINGKSLSKTDSLISGEEIVINRGHGLRIITFDCLFQNGTTKYPFANYRIGNTYTATMFIAALKSLIAICKPFQFIVTRISPAGDLLFFTNIKCILGDYEIIEDAESLGQDVQIHITLQEYLPYKTKTAIIRTNDDGDKVATFSTTRDDSSFEVPQKYIVNEPDTLFNIARSITGDSSNLKMLAEYNNITDIFNIPAGTQIEIPQSLQTTTLQNLLGVIV